MHSTSTSPGSLARSTRVQNGIHQRRRRRSGQGNSAKVREGPILNRDLLAQEEAASEEQVLSDRSFFYCLRIDRPIQIHKVCQLATLIEP